MSEDDQHLDKQYQQLVPFFGQEHTILKGAISKEMQTFGLELFEVSNRLTNWTLCYELMKYVRMPLSK